MLYVLKFVVAESYEEFQEVLENRSVAEQTVIVERMVKTNHPSLGNNNRSNLQRLYPYLLQHLNDNAHSIVSFNKNFNKIIFVAYNYNIIQSI